MTDQTSTASGAAKKDEAAALEPTQAEIDEWAARERQRRAGVAERPVRGGARRLRAAPPAPPAGRRPSTKVRPASPTPSGWACATDARASSRWKARWRSSIACRAGASRSWSVPVVSGKRRRPSRPVAGACRWTTRARDVAGPTPGHPVARASRQPSRRRAVAVIRATPHENAVPAPAPGLARPRRLLRPVHRSGPPPARLRPAQPAGPDAARLRALGGAWIKLGQMLALRFDLLPAAYCDELFKLLNQVAPFSYDGGPRHRPQGARCRTRVGLPVVLARVVRGGLDRPGPPRGAPQRRAGRGQGPAAGHPQDARGGHRA